MMASMARRGPDSEGLELWPGAALGHRRLAILDLSAAGHQPMLSEDGETGVVFNGCIYNFLELREELIALGCRFRSNTDTEVLVHGYERWGIDRLVARLRGMFAFAIWSNRQRRLTLVRDRLGVKPLIYVARADSIGFASTVTALRDAGLAEEINPDAVLEYLEFGWVSDRQTIYKGVEKVPAATIVEWENGHLQERCYWKPPEPGTYRGTFSSAVDEAEALLLEAAKLRLIADVPIGTLLSGGIDSALVCWAMSKVGGAVRSFTVGTPGDPADETSGAQETAQLLGIPHEVIRLEQNTRDLSDLDDLTTAYGEPFACSSALGMLKVCKAVKEKATVLLTGDGGDDVFLGYRHHMMLWTAERMGKWLPPGIAPVWQRLEPLAMRSPLLRRPWRMIDYASGGLGAVTAANDGLPWFGRSDYLGERLGRIALPDRQIPRSSKSGRVVLRDFLEYERNTRFVSEYMTKVDGGAMHYAIEARSPFLDQRLWEFAAGLPFSIRLHRGEKKAVLRELVRRHVGIHVATRRKQGFTIPVERWMLSKWGPEMYEIASESLLEQNGWLRRGAIRSAIAEAKQRDAAPVQLWFVLVLEQWMRRHTHRDTAVAVGERPLVS
jgi:asparagine synthase (glutamine-hydrolysing)